MKTGTGVLGKIVELVNLSEGYEVRFYHPWFTERMQTQEKNLARYYRWYSDASEEFYRLTKGV